MNEYRHYATACIDRLLQWYDPEIGLWEDAGWWNNANILEAVIDYASLTQTDQYDPFIADMFNKGKIPSQRQGSALDALNAALFVLGD